MAEQSASMPMFYRNVVALSREQHKGWYIDTDQGYGFTEATNSVYLAASEFSLASREYPIVFARDGGGQVVPAALLGLRPDENLMLGDDKTWQASYIPAYIRRYPFILATPNAESQEFTVCIDESYSGFNTANEGSLLIDPAGEHSEQLQKTVKFLQDFQQHSLVTKAFCEAIDAAGLFETMQAEVKLNNGENFTVSGFLSVTRERIGGLTADKLKELCDANYLELVYLHLNSLSNLDPLMRRVRPASTTVQ